MAEKTLSDCDGDPATYVTDDLTIYLWSGDAVAHLVNDRVYTWNGRYLGWFSSGVLLDLRGHRVGSIRIPRC